MPGTITPPSGGGGATALTALTDTPAGYGANGQVLTTNGVNATTWETPAGAFAWPDIDWRAHASAVGVGTGTPLVLGDYPDLSVADGGVALAAAPSLTAAGRLIITPTSGTVDGTPAGIKIADVAAGDYTAIVAFGHVFTGLNANATGYYEIGLAGFTGTDTQADSFAGGVLGRANDAMQTGYYAKWTDSGLGGRDVAFTSAAQRYALDHGRSFSMALTRVGNVVSAYIGDGDSWDFLYSNDEGSAPAGIVALMCSCETAAATLKVGLTNVLTLDDGAAGAGTLPGWA